MDKAFSGVVRPVREQDLAAIQRIVDEWHGDGEGTVASVRDSLGGASTWSYFVAEQDHRVIGVAGLATSGIDPELGRGSGQKAELISAYVESTARGRGVGRALAERVEQTAADLGYDELLIVSGSRNSEAGYPFWRKRYGEPLRIDEDYFGPGAERVVWAAELHD